jgi:hypothetical protein
MGKGFLKLKLSERQICVIILLLGMAGTAFLGANAFKETKLENGYELLRNEPKEGDYEEALIATIGDERVSLNVTVSERMLNETEAKEELLKARDLISEFLKGENESLKKITTDLNFLTEIPETSVEIQWVDKAPDYFTFAGERRKEVVITEPVEIKLSAILTCREFSEDYETTITLFPAAEDKVESLQRLIKEENQQQVENKIFMLPDVYEGNSVTWRKKPDTTFLLVFLLMIMAVFLIKLGGKRDQESAKKDRLEFLEKEYAKLVSKFTMLLSAGLSIRNAWERIVLLYRRKGNTEDNLFRELNWGLLQMQKGVSELEVYEAVGARFGNIHYKKLMAMFISDRKRGSVNLLDAMNHEMLSAWEEQKRKSRQQGEKIGTKLLIPMMGMLGIVFVIVMMPALLSFGN